MMIMINSHREDGQTLKRDWLKGSAFSSTVYRLSNSQSPLLSALRRKIVSVGGAAAEYLAHVCNKSWSCWISHILATWDPLLRRFVSSLTDVFNYKKT